MARADLQHGLQTEQCFQTTAMHVVWQAFGYTEELLFPGTTAATAVIYSCPHFSTHLSTIFAGQFVDNWLLYLFISTSVDCPLNRT